MTLQASEVGEELTQKSQRITELEDTVVVQEKNYKQLQDKLTELVSCV